MTDYSTTEHIDTLVEIVLDRSGSMSSIRQDTIGGLNSYIENLRKEAKGKTKVGLTQFDSGYQNGNHVTQLIRSYYSDLESVKEMTTADYQPSGGTPLYDAVGQVITKLEAHLTGVDPKPSVILIIITDGGNTDSHGHSAEAVKAMVQRNQDAGWSVVYLGANQDAWAVGSTFGVAQGNTRSYSTQDMGKVFRSVATASAYHATESYGAKLGNVDMTYTTKDFFEEAGVKDEDLN